MSEGNGWFGMVGDEPAQTRGSRRAGFFRLFVGLLLTAGMFLLSACGTQSPGQPLRSGDGKAGSAAPAAVATRAVGDCIDGTSSSVPGFAVQMRDMLAAAVSAWVRQPPTHPTAAQDAQLGLHLVLRPVSTYSTSTDNPNLDASIPPVPTLAPEPQPTSSSFDQNIHSWLGTEAGWRQKALTAKNAAASLSAQVRSFHLVRHTLSGVYSCLATAAAQLQTYGPATRLVLMSDLLNNRPVVGLRLRGDAVLVVAACPAWASQTCPPRLAAARRYLLRHGASTVLIVRSDAATAATLDSFWRGS